MATKEKLFTKLSEILSIYNKSEIEKINIAYKYAELKHKGQKRASGEEFIIHPLSVAIHLAEMNVDHEMIIAGLLHDVVEDTETKLIDIKEKFGENVARLVDGVTKISKLKPAKTKDVKAETIRKMLFSMINDMKIIVVKFADKMHNLDTLNFLPAEKRKKIVNETLEIYAPLAGKMGMHFIKDRLEDLALRWLNPDAYMEIKNYFDRTEKDRKRTTQLITQNLREKLLESKVPFTIKARAKHFYSIYKKMKKYNVRVDGLFDLYGIRVITDSIQNCYQIFGVIHSLWQPIPGRFKDYIAHPKKNGYKSLHTSVVVERRKIVEIQIRTQEMDEFNEYGVAAHWYYKNGHIPKTEQLEWLQKLIEVHKQTLSPEEYYKAVRDDILKDEIYVFSPKGDIYDLPKGATAIDYAYRIHTEVGHRCVGAKANGQIIPLNRPLKNGMIIEIITSNISNPKQSWLSIIKTTNARKKIKSWFAAGKDNEDVDFRNKTEKKIIDKTSEKIVKKEIKLELNNVKKEIEVNGERNLLYSFARCCNPAENDEIIGFVSRGRGIIVHKKGCYNLKYIKDFDKRVISVNWVKKV